jgi:membrane-bound lytic murein transglycosylase D
MKPLSFALPSLSRIASAGLLALVLAGCATAPPPPEAPSAAWQPPAPAPPPPPPTPAQVQITPLPDNLDLLPPAEPVAPAEPPMVALPAATQPPIDPIERPVALKPNPVLGLQAQTDIWERIRRGFAMPDLDNDLVRNREQWYASRPDYMLRMTERSRPYLFHIVEELERRKMPTELALLPFIESAFNPQAVSSAKAAGMWQFMPATGKYFDLKQNLFRDERRDVLESTRAALDYLQKLYNTFDDWHLALAAYNWGQGSVGRALARNRAQGKPLTYSDLNMPNETRFYVPKLQAVKNIVANPDAFNAQLPLIQNHPYFKSVAIERDIDVAVAAKLAQVSLADFKALNPAMSRPVILAAGTPQILLPWDNADIFESNLQARPDRRLASWTAWQAPRTMKAEDVAKQVGMDVAQLRSVNGIPPRMMIKAGSTLLVPRQAHLDNDVAGHLADNGQLALAPEVVLRRIMVKARQGDTLSALAARHGVSAANVAAWNKLRPNARLTAGQTLAVFVPSKAAKKSARSVQATQRRGSQARSPQAKRSAPQARSPQAKRKPTSSPQR